MGHYSVHHPASRWNLPRDCWVQFTPSHTICKLNFNLMFVDPCVMVQFIKKNPTRFNNVSKFLLFHIYMKINMFRARHRPSSGA